VTILVQFSHSCCCYFNSWFNHANYNSFQRQLNIYGFRRFPKGRDKNAYYHQDFVCGKYQQTFNMNRNVVKNTGCVRRSSDTGTHPDFYQRQRSRVEDSHVPTTTSRTTSAVSRWQPESVSAPALPIAPLIPPHESIFFSSNPFDTQIQNYLRTNHRTLEAANASSTAMPPNPYSYGRNSLFPSSELLGIPRQSATILYASSILARTEMSRQMEVLLLHARCGSVVEEMIQAQALLATLQRPHRRHEIPLVFPLANEGRNHPYSDVPPAFRPEEVVDLLVRHSLYPPGGAGL
jgi:HSF-type DNA-binding